ncbi:basic region leucine zipper [Trichuris suis]|nr:basic region leucine zipper [Trichuris suis]
MFSIEDNVADAIMHCPPKLCANLSVLVNPETEKLGLSTNCDIAVDRRKINYILNSIALESSLSARHLLGPLVTPLNGSSATSLAPLLGQTSSLVGAADSQSETQVSTAGSETASLLLRRRRKYNSRISNENPTAPQETPSDRKEKLNSDEEQSNAYWERRRRNNNAAKRSRAARRVKEEEIALRAAYLEQENLKLKAQGYKQMTATTEFTNSQKRMFSFAQLKNWIENIGFGQF